MVEVTGSDTVVVTTANVTAAGGSMTINETGADAAVTVSAAVAAGSTVILGEALSFTLSNNATGVTIADEADGADAGTSVADESTETVTLGSTGNIVTGSASKDTIAFTASTTGDHSISLGAADDTVTAAQLIAAGDTVVGGAGTDTLSLLLTVRAILI